MKEECDHKVWVDPERIVEIDSWTGEQEYVWSEGYWESAEEDIDTHRFKCTLCGEIGYYSGAAKDHFEGRNVQSWIDKTNKKR